nr:immunoglobulin heavy chain junction region [Mus musculus]
CANNYYLYAMDYW